MRNPDSVKYITDKPSADSALFLFDMLYNRLFEVGVRRFSAKKSHELKTLLSAELSGIGRLISIYRLRRLCLATEIHQKFPEIWSILTPEEKSFCHQCNGDRAIKKLEAEQDEEVKKAIIRMEKDSFPQL